MKHIKCTASRVNVFKKNNSLLLIISYIIGFWNKGFKRSINTFFKTHLLYFPDVTFADFSASIKATCAFIHFCLVLAAFKVQHGWCHYLRMKVRMNAVKYWLKWNRGGEGVLLIYYLSFASNLMLPTLMLKGWESTQTKVWWGRAIEPKVSATNSCFDIAKHNPLVFWAILTNIKRQRSPTHWRWSLCICKFVSSCLLLILGVLQFFIQNKYSSAKKKRKKEILQKWASAPETCLRLCMVTAIVSTRGGNRCLHSAQHNKTGSLNHRLLWI